MNVDRLELTGGKWLDANATHIPIGRVQLLGSFAKEPAEIRTMSKPMAGLSRSKNSPEHSGDFSEFIGMKAVRRRWLLRNFHSGLAVPQGDDFLTTPVRNSASVGVCVGSRDPLGQSLGSPCSSSGCPQSMSSTSLYPPITGRQSSHSKVGPKEQENTMGRG